MEMVSAAGGMKGVSCYVVGDGEGRRTKESAMIVLRPAAMAGREGGRQSRE